MAEKIFTADERKAFEKLAQRRGFKSLRRYVRMLIKQDAEQHGEAVAIETDDELDDPIESFRAGWADAMEGRTMSYEEFERRMSEDAD